MPETVLQKGVPDVSSTGEDDRAREPDLETVQEEPVDRDAPPEEEVVEHGEEAPSGDTV